MQRGDSFCVDDFVARDHSQRLIERNTIDVDHLIVIEFAVRGGQIARQKQRNAFSQKLGIVTIVPS